MTKETLASLPIGEDIIKKYAPETAYVESFLREHGIEVKESVAYMFYNHLFAFLERMTRGECVQALTEADISDQLTKESISLARELSAPLFRKFGRDAEECEIMLFATYFVMFLG